MTTVLDRLTAWVEKQSSVGPAAFKQALAEIRRDVERESKTLAGREATAKSDVLRVANWLETVRPPSDEARQIASRLRGFATAVFGPDSKYVEVLAQQMGEFARDELGASLADVDAAIAADKEQERVSKPKKRAAKPKARKVKP